MSCFLFIRAVGAIANTIVDAAVKNGYFAPSGTRQVVRLSWSALIQHSCWFCKPAARTCSWFILTSYYTVTVVVIELAGRYTIGTRYI